MPEGDTIFRAATTLRQWIGGRTVTSAEARIGKADLRRLVGAEVEVVEARGKHLLMRFSNGLTLHTHMRMTGSWHVYARGDRWKKPGWQARVIIECGDRMAVGFNVPVVELLTSADEVRHAPLQALGPDLLAEGEMSEEEILRRARAVVPTITVGELLLLQSVAAGIGNIYRCESLFLEGVHPETTVVMLPDAQLVALYATARRLLLRNAGSRGDSERDFAFAKAPGSGPWVYGRAGKPCAVCGAVILSGPLGDPSRTVYWCPTCQVRPTPVGE
jgi:endonuclease-8